MSATSIDCRRVDALIDQHLDQLIEIRHDLHAHPQLGYQETYASGLVQRELTALGVPFQAGIAETGVVAWLRSDRHRRDNTDACIALRADMDALPLQEETGLSYASQHTGLMHACGHDGHTAMLIGAARVLAAMVDDLPRPVKLLFQPAEEGGAGAQRMIDQGAMSTKVGGLRVTQVYGLHGHNEVTLGTMSTRPGPLAAAAAIFQITLTGSGGHAAHPHSTRDPVVAGAQLVTALQTIVSRNVDPTDSAVVTVAQLHAGTGDATNIIPATAALAGTIRTLKGDTFDRVSQRLQVLAEQIAAAFELAADVQIQACYPCTDNDPAATAYAMDVARRVLGESNVEQMRAPLMGAEDFSFYTQHAPACFAMLGLCPPDRDAYPNLHSPQFDFSDSAIRHGVALLCHWALAGGIET